MDQEPLPQMSPEQFAERMRRIDDNGDIECGHKEGDQLMIYVLRSLGYGKGCDVFDKMGKWYA